LPTWIRGRSREASKPPTRGSSLAGAGEVAGEEPVEAMVTRRAEPSQRTWAPRASATKRSGTTVRPPTTEAGTSRFTVRPSTVAVREPSGRVIWDFSERARTVRLGASHWTSAPRASKIPRRGTSTRPSCISGGWSKLSARPSTVTEMSAAARAPAVRRAVRVMVIQARSRCIFGYLLAMESSRGRRVSRPGGWVGPGPVESPGNFDMRCPPCLLRPLSALP